MTWWFCADQSNSEKYVWVEADRWFDARRTAWQILGSEKLWVTHPKTEHTTPPKKAYVDKAVYRAHWEGSAAGLNDLRLEVDRILMRRMICTNCTYLYWPWEVEVLGGRKVHIVAGTVADACGPVIIRERVEVESPSDFTALLRQSVDMAIAMKTGGP